MSSRHILLLSATLSVYFLGNAQGVKITAPEGNAVLQQFHRQHPSFRFEPPKHSRAAGDTLKLPFFDDFSLLHVFPNPAKWADNDAYVNATFPVSPPSFGVATLDNLNSKGNPYNGLGGTMARRSDSLTTRYINLKNTTAADSVYLSFFYQPQGLGDILDNSDTLFLEFRDTAGKWIKVWQVKGSKLQPFTQVLVGVLDAKYFSSAFQFRFVNWTKNTGNMNQWHIDYVLLDKGRNRRDTAIRDIAINKVPTPVMQWYYSMPYDHFKLDYNNERATRYNLTYRNNYSTAAAKNTAVRLEVYNQYNQLIDVQPFDSINANLDPLSERTETNLKPVKLDTLSGKKPYVTFVYKASERPGLGTLGAFPAKDPTPLNADNSDTNNTYFQRQYFDNYFAYDDGSAEGGFGLDYSNLPNGPGYAACKFHLNKADTLRGISVFFNQSVADVKFKSFDLLVWQTISEPPAGNMNNDKILYRFPVTLSQLMYRDTINGFYTFVFDTVLVIPQGNFYIGWEQNTNFILNVGYDNNYHFNHVDSIPNPNLFYNLLGYWSEVSNTITGAIMMRPIVGDSISDPLSVFPVRSRHIAFKLYPNPVNHMLHIDAGDLQIARVELTDLFGRTLYISENNLETIDMSGFSAGTYWVRLTGKNNTIHTQPCIKTE